MPEVPFLQNAKQASSATEDEGVGQQPQPFRKPRPPSISGTTGGTGKVSSKSSVSDIPEAVPVDARGDFEDEEDILTQYGSQKNATDNNDHTVMAPAAAATTNAADFETFDDVTACEEAAAAAAEPVESVHSEDAQPEATNEAPTTTAPPVNSASNTTASTTTAGEESESQLDSQDSMVYEVFKNLRIAMLGFSGEEVADLTELIESSLGTVVTCTPTTLKGPEADYLIVPIQVRKVESYLCPSGFSIIYFMLGFTYRLLLIIIL